MLLLLLLLSLSCLFQKVVSAPAPTPTQYVSWQSEPDGRGTWSIISSCVVTLVLCVYTAIHTSVPPASENPAQRRKNKAAWVCAGIFAPEYVVWTAWCQWCEARHLTREVERIRLAMGVSDKDPATTTIPWEERRSARRLLSSWTLRHSFFVVMGGYQFHPDTIIHRPPWQRGSRGYEFYESDESLVKAVVTVPGFIALLEAGHAENLPVLSLQDLQDRSKADDLAKILSCVQGLWLIIQLAGRLASSVVITELEVNTLAHVLCAVAMYMFWMQKPLQVTQPVWVEPNGIEPWLLAHAGLSSTSRNLLSRCASDLEQETSTHLHPRLDFDCPVCLQTAERRPVFGLRLPDASSLSAVQLLQQCPKGRFNIDFVTENSPNLRVLQEDFKPARNIVLCLGPSELESFLRFWQLGQRDDLIAKMGDPPPLKRASEMVKGSYTLSHVPLLVMMAISACYGGLHASLWQHHFPTSTERWLWRISSLIVAGNGVFAAMAYPTLWIGSRTGGNVVITVMGYFVQLVNWTVPNDVEDEEQSSPTGQIFVAAFSCSLVVFAVCRVFLFVEAFTSLRSQPDSAYQSPVWTQWLPHF